MNFTRVDFIENLHPDKSVENDRKMDRRRCTKGLSGAIFDSEDFMSFEEKHHDYDNLKAYFRA